VHAVEVVSQLQVVIFVEANCTHYLFDAAECIIYQMLQFIIFIRCISGLRTQHWMCKIPLSLFSIYILWMIN